MTKMSDRPRIPRPLAPGGRVIVSMIVLMALALFALVMTGAGAAIVWLVRWISATNC